MLEFQKNSAITFKASAIDIITSPALAGAWFEVALHGRVTQHGQQTMVLDGSLQFNLPENSLLWPKLDFKQVSQPQNFRDSYDDTLRFQGYISYAQLEAFEKERMGKDFSVQVTAWLRTITQKGELSDWHINNGHLRKNAQDWTGALSSCGYKKYLVHELSFPGSSSVNIEESVFSHLCKARNHFDNGLYRECVSCLRQVEEKLRSKRNDQVAITEALKAMKENREAMTLTQRMLVLRNSVQNALHTAPHSYEPDNAFTRETAKALLIIVSALVELFPEPEEQL